MVLEITSASVSGSRSTASVAATPKRFWPPAVRRTDFNDRTWKPALVAAGVIPQPRPGKRHQAAREHGMHALRHFYASVLLDAGENIKALSHYLGHSDPGFTLRVYTHLMPSSDARARKAVDSLHEGTDPTPDGPETAQGL